MENTDKKHVVILGGGSRELAILKSLRKDQIHRGVGSNIIFCYHTDSKNPAIPMTFLDDLEIN